MQQDLLFVQCIMQDGPELLRWRHLVGHCVSSLTHGQLRLLEGRYQQCRNATKQIGEHVRPLGWKNS